MENIIKLIQDHQALNKNTQIALKNLISVESTSNSNLIKLLEEYDSILEKKARLWSGYANSLASGSSGSFNKSEEKMLNQKLNEISILLKDELKSVLEQIQRNIKKIILLLDEQYLEEKKEETIESKLNVVNFK
ncbi:hypothetical protein K9L97_03235 [Candidatus Woesearchaeota archaeon]|nr:hypothetical protein [Candidatus Woesearchaeota archaeon]